MRQLFSFLGMMLLLSSCGGEEELVSGIPANLSEHITVIPDYDQRVGDVLAGKEYLLSGDYIKSGIPREVYDNTLALTTNPQNVLNRSGINEDIYFEYTASLHPNGVEVVSPNCFQCHGGYVDGEYILGLGNTLQDFTTDQSGFGGLLDGIVEGNYGIPSPEWDAYFPFSRGVSTTGSLLITESVGANPADKLALVLAAHRDKDDLTWREVPEISIPDEVVPADVPAWWLLKKKSVMFSTGIGRGDYAKMMMASSILTLEDSTEARIIDDRFVDVKEFILSIEAPVYPQNINIESAKRGEELFKINCVACHGSYGADPSYQTILVEHEILGTDPLLANSNYAYAEFEKWFNTSWFSKDRYAAAIVPGDDYIAQPLDGVWATAPYFHNGSVPTLEDVLNSSGRPTYWSVTGSRDNYDHEKAGLTYTIEQGKINKFTYDTTLPGYGNMGHVFGDHLTETQRQDLIEYLKTL